MEFLQDYLSIIKVDIAVTIGAIWSFIIRSIVWRISGVHSQLQDIRDGKEKVYTAQVLHNRYTLPGNEWLSPNSFLFTHDHFAPAATILRDNVHFLGFENDVVKFIELDSESDIFNLRKNPLLFISQAAHTKKMIVLQLDDFTEVLDKNYVDGVKVVWCFHSVRCGSTLWAQMFAALPNWVAYSEPQSMFYSIARAREILDIAELTKTEEYEKMVVACIKMHILMAPKGHSIFWKTMELDEHMVPVIKKHFPSHTILFACRDCLPSAKSFYKAFGQLPFIMNSISHAHQEIQRGTSNLSKAGHIGWFLLTNGYSLQFCLRVFRDHKPKPNGFEWQVMYWSVKIKMMMEFRKDGIHFKALKYEELCEDPVGTITDLFKHLDISLDLVEVAHKTMELDSQAATSFSHKKRVDLRSWSRTPESDRRCNGILQAFDLPDLDSHLVL